MSDSREPTKAEFHQAIARRGDRWYGACLRITRNPDLAQDAVQDALLNAWNKRHQYQGSSQLETWIHRIAVNCALQLLRRSRHGIEASLDHELTDEDSGPEGKRIDSELDEKLDHALSGLSQLERVCFVLKHLEQWRLKEIAAELNINIGTVKQALFRGVRKLRPKMASIKE